MNDFFFTWINGTADRPNLVTQDWMFHSGDNFSLLPGQARVNEQQFDVGDTLSFVVSGRNSDVGLKVVMGLTMNKLGKPIWYLQTGSKFTNLVHTVDNQWHVSCYFPEPL